VLTRLVQVCLIGPRVVPRPSDRKAIQHDVTRLSGVALILPPGGQRVQLMNDTHRLLFAAPSYSSRMNNGALRANQAVPVVEEPIEA
jgi:hypothetical protein